MTGMEYGPEWLAAIIVILAVLFGLFFRRERRIYEWATWRDHGVRELLDDVAEETGADVLQFQLRPYDRERDDQ